MSQFERVRRLRALPVALLCLEMLWGAALCAASEHAVSPAAFSPALPERVYGLGEDQTPATGALAFKDRESETTWGVFTRLIVVLLIFTAGAYGIIHYARKGKLNLGALRAYNTDPQLVISESRMLGNRQYLMVVEYAEQKMLLAVTPAGINHLCFLETPYEGETAVNETDESA